VTRCSAWDAFWRAADASPLPPPLALHGNGAQRGLFATRELRRGDVVLSLPLSSALLEPVGVSATSSDLRLAQQLAEALETEPLWKAYGAFLPATAAAPTEAWAAQLHWPPAIQLAVEASVRAAAVSPDETLLRWCHALVCTRSLMVYTDGKLARCLCPLLDQVNNEQPTVEQLRSGELQHRAPDWRVTPAGRLELTASRDVAAGEELRMWYGALTNAEIVASHGYLPLLNATDCLPLYASVHEMMADMPSTQLTPAKRSLLSGSFEAGWRPLALSRGLTGLVEWHHLQGCLRVLAAAEHELPALHEAYCDGCGHPVWQWRDGEAHVETEGAARAIARARAAALLSAMPPLSEDAASADEPVAVAFRVGVKRLLTDFVLQ
jgi:hypothetical protein